MIYAAMQRIVPGHIYMHRPVEFGAGHDCTEEGTFSAGLACIGSMTCCRCSTKVLQATKARHVSCKRQEHTPTCPKVHHGCIGSACCIHILHMRSPHDLLQPLYMRSPYAGMPAYSVPVPLQAYFLGTPHAQHPALTGTLALDLWPMRDSVFYSLGLVRNLS